MDDTPDIRDTGRPGGGEWLAAPEMFWVHSGNALGSAKGLEPRLVGRWNKLLSHYDSQCSQRARPFVGRPIGHRPGQARLLQKWPGPE